RNAADRPTRLDRRSDRPAGRLRPARPGRRRRRPRRPAGRRARLPLAGRRTRREQRPEHRRGRQQHRGRRPAAAGLRHRPRQRADRLGGRASDRHPAGHRRRPGRRRHRAPRAPGPAAVRPLLPAATPEIHRAGALHGRIPRPAGGEDRRHLGRRPAGDPHRADRRHHRRRLQPAPPGTGHRLRRRSAQPRPAGRPPTPPAGTTAHQRRTGAADRRQRGLPDRTARIPHLERPGGQHPRHHRSQRPPVARQHHAGPRTTAPAGPRRPTTATAAGAPRELGGHMRSLDLVVIGLYLVAMPALGMLLSGRQRTSKDYFVGSRQLPWWAVCFSVVATETSTLTVISVPTVAYLGTFTYLQLAIGYLIGRLVVAFVLLPKYYAGNLVSAYEFLGQRFGSGLQGTASVTFLLTRLLADGLRLFATAIPVKVILDS